MCVCHLAKKVIRNDVCDMVFEIIEMCARTMMTMVLATRVLVKVGERSQCVKAEFLLHFVILVTKM